MPPTSRRRRPQLNHTLTSIRDGLRAIDGSLAGVIANVQQQERS